MASNDSAFSIRGEFITLGQLVKVLDLVGSGGEAKDLLTSGGFTVNGETEDRRGRKLRPGDRVGLPDGATITIE